MLVAQDLFLHTIFSLLCGYFAWKRFDSKNRQNLFLSIFIGLLAGVLNDVDHLFDYFMAHGPHFSLYSFLSSGSYSDKKIFVLLHGFEYVIVLAVLTGIAKKTKWKMIFSSAMLSHFMHLMVDVIFLGNPVLLYSLIYRILNGFNR